MEGRNEDSLIEMQLLQQNLSDDLQYVPLWHLLERRHFAAFKSLLDRALNRDPPSVDVNHILGHPMSKRFLDQAASDDLPMFVELLLDRGADPNLVNAKHSRAPIHFAAERGNVTALAALLRDTGINPNLEVSGSTALHWAVKACAENRAGGEECARLLLEAGASASLPNNRGLTALHFAAEKNCQAIVELILTKSRDPLFLDTFKDRKNETARTVIERKYPNLPLPDKSSSDQEDPNILLRYYLGANDEINFLAKLDSLEEPQTELAGSRFDLLRLAVEQNLRGCLVRLARVGLQPESSELPDLGRAALRRAHPEVLRELLENSPKLADDLLLTACQELGAPAKPGPGNRNNRLECLRLILERKNVDVRQEDDKGNSPLHYASRAECREAVDLLLKRGCYIGHTNHFGSPALSHMEPAQLEAHLDDCLTSSRERTEDYEIVMDYSNLVPHEAEARLSPHPGDDDRLIAPTIHTNGRRGDSKRGDSGKGLLKSELRCETEVLLYMAKHGHMRPLLKHPLLSSFLYLKFLRIRHVLYLNFLLYFIFFVSLNLYIYVVCANESMKTSDTEGAQVINSSGSSWSEQPLLSGLLLASLLYMVVRELLQLASAPLHYVSSAENWLELGLAALAGVLLWHGGGNSESNERCREIGAVATLLSTWQLICLMAQHPRLTTSIEMFKTVTCTFVKCISLYLLLIIAFAFSFFVLFQGAKSDDNDRAEVIFPTVNASLFKTLVMLTGEFEAGDLPFGASPFVGRLVFVGFIFLVCIILLNLLNGLAVSDTAEILAEAELVGLSARARLVAYAERVATGSAYHPRGRLASLLCCCCDGLASRIGLVKPLMGLLARRILLFPRHLPQDRLSVRPLRNYEMRPALSGAGVGMDKTVVTEAKAILARRARESDEEKIVARLDALGGRLGRVEIALSRLLTAQDSAGDSRGILM
ncbi:hypothetical protein QAD02_012439 [Eretmocerus hayati]|uniref:Uncharacterized protein n=1 Tax=Eretmocerus hayati TaxID=131215 RepID=A0ACC2NZQ3_9HYME|nr:hypothetical protein QAD02_012439 [Eretmocerus hayati]